MFFFTCVNVVLFVHYAFAHYAYCILCDLHILRVVIILRFVHSVQKEIGLFYFKSNVYIYVTSRTNVFQKANGRFQDKCAYNTNARKSWYEAATLGEDIRNCWVPYCGR